MTFLAGEILTADNLNAAFPITKTKLADESVAASTTLQDDNHLTLSLLANRSYAYWFDLVYGAPAGRLKTQLSVPSGATGTLVGVDDTAAFFSSLTGVLSFTPTTGVRLVRMWGNIVTTNAGTFKLTWAQVSASGTTTISAGSSLLVVPL